MQLPKRFRRLRGSQVIRDFVAETDLSPRNFIVPLFMVEGNGIKDPISSMPGYYRLAIGQLSAELLELKNLKLNSVLLFAKCPDHLKDNEGKEALNPDGLMQRSIRAIKKIAPQMTVMTDIALDPYSKHGHDGIVDGSKIVNDRTVDVLARMAISHAAAGADFVAPSDMMDGRVKSIREALDQNGFIETGILSYSAKYASSFYGPFRDALDSAPGFGDKKTYQMDFRNANEAIREVMQDIEEGADIVMIKPGGPYLDVVNRVKQTVNTPIAVYQVSGEYAMIIAASDRGWLDRTAGMIESLTAIRRAGADIIVSYFAKDYARHWLQEIHRA
ncbi:MAG TPA: porphobilinogen synthase [Chitinophagales bacterium]|nr:porphobilinogen synthase [Chitinophagales bacterium]